MVHCEYQKVKGYNFQIKLYICLSMNIVIVLTNSVDPDEILRFEKFHLDLHCLQKYAFRSYLYTKGW